MGYYVTLVDEDFEIIALCQPRALQAVKDLMVRTDLMGGGAYEKGAVVKRWFSWVDTAQVLEAETLAEALKAWNFDSDTNEKGSLVGLEFIGEKWGDQEHLLRALAPYVRDNSFLEWQGEDGEGWLYTFRNGRLYEQKQLKSWGEPRDISLTEGQA